MSDPRFDRAAHGDGVWVEGCRATGSSFAHAFRLRLRQCLQHRRVEADRHGVRDCLRAVFGMTRWRAL